MLVPEDMFSAIIEIYDRVGWKRHCDIVGQEAACDDGILYPRPV